jgi:hypothetical protein
MDPHQDRRRGHFRGRRGPDRRGFDRRPPAQGPPVQGRDQLDVEQIMREIRARIAQRQGVELSHQQIDDLAARRLEYILDPRAMKPEFLDTLRLSADEALARQEKRLPAEPVYVFEDTTVYDSHRAILRGIRKLLNPLLKLFLNPNPLIRALHQQAKLNVEAAERDAARDRQQAEWNALHYRIVQRLVAEVSRLSLEAQALATRVESLGGRVDFNDRRVRAMEGTVHQLRPAGRPPDAPPAGRSPDAPPAGRPPDAPPAGRPPDAPPVRPPEVPQAADGAPEAAPAEGGRRRRRRRRGRRGSMPLEGLPAAGPEAPGAQPASLESDAREELDAGAAPPSAEEGTLSGSGIGDPGSGIEEAGSEPGTPEPPAPGSRIPDPGSDT